MAASKTIKYITELTDEDIEKLQFKTEIVDKLAQFINLESKITFILPKRYCTGVKYFSELKQNRPALTYTIYTIKHPHNNELIEEDKKIYERMEKIVSVLKQRFAEVSEKNSKINNIYTNIKSKNNGIIPLMGFKFYDPNNVSTDKINGKFNIYIPLDKGSIEKSSKTMIYNEKKNPINHDEIINDSGKKSNTGFYTNIISIIGITIVKSSVTLSIKWESGCFIRALDVKSEQINLAMNDICNAENELLKKNNASTINEIDEDEDDDDYKNVVDSDLSNKELEDYSKQMKELNI